MIEERRRNEERRLGIREEQYKEYLTNVEKKKVNDFISEQERKELKNVSLDLHHEERLNNMKGYINKLSEKVDRNAEVYKNYISGKPYRPEMSIDVPQSLRQEISGKRPDILTGRNDDSVANENAYDQNNLNENENNYSKPENYLRQTPNYDDHLRLNSSFERPKQPAYQDPDFKDYTDVQV